MFKPIFFAEQNSKWLRIEFWKIEKPDGTYFNAKFKSEKDAMELCDVLNVDVEEEET